MNNSEDILAKIKSVINEIIDVDDSKFSPNANLRDDLGADSLASVEIVMALEEIFDVEFTEEQAKSVQTVGDVIAFITDNTVSISSPEVVA